MLDWTFIHVLISKQQPSLRYHYVIKNMSLNFKKKNSYWISKLKGQNIPFMKHHSQKTKQEKKNPQITTTISQINKIPSNNNKPHQLVLLKLIELRLHKSLKLKELCVISPVHGRTVSFQRVFFQCRNGIADTEMPSYMTACLQSRRHTCVNYRCSGSDVIWYFFLGLIGLFRYIFYINKVIEVRIGFWCDLEGNLFILFW